MKIYAPLIIIATLLTFYLGVLSADKKEINITTAECPSIMTEVKIEKIELDEGWKCDKPKMTTDLLQPSGYWIGDTISCWKLETPIEEYKKEMCIKTNDDYWCKFTSQ